MKLLDFFKILILIPLALPVVNAQDFKSSNGFIREQALPNTFSSFNDDEVTVIVILDSFSKVGVNAKDECSEKLKNAKLKSLMKSNDVRVNNLLKSGFNVVRESNNLVTVKIKKSELSKLKSQEGVKSVITSDKVFESFLSTSVPSINASTWWNASYNGSWVDVAVVDSGIRTSHEILVDWGNGSPSRNFTQRSFVFNESPEDLDGHGTHVAGIIASTHATYTGVAYGITGLINAKALNASGAGLTNELMSALDWAVTNSTTNADVVSNSWGSYSTPDGDSNISKFVDALSDNYDTLMVFAAGNAGPSLTTVGVPGDAYNVLTVGAVDDNDTINRSDDFIANYSSRGPAYGVWYLNSSIYYYRKKPDIVAPGSGIISSYNTGDSFYASMDGTSMAAPHVSGAAALLRQSGLIPMEVKALLINSAEDFGTQAWDNDYGWGYMDLSKAYELKDYVVTDSKLTNGSEYYIGNVSPGDKATLVWNRHVDYDNDTVVFSDLDLYLYTNYSNLVDSSTSFMDNVEQVVSPGDYVNAVVRVTPYHLPVFENYSLSFPSDFTKVSGPSLSFSYSQGPDLNSSDLPGQFELNLTFFNFGDVRALLSLNLSHDLVSDWVNVSDYSLGVGEYYNRSVLFNVSEPATHNAFLEYGYSFAGLRSSSSRSLSFSSIESPIVIFVSPSGVDRLSNHDFLARVTHPLNITNLTSYIDLVNGSDYHSVSITPLNNDWYFFSGYGDLLSDSYRFYINTTLNDSQQTTFSSSAGFYSDNASAFPELITNVSLSYPGDDLDVNDDLNISFDLVFSGNESPFVAYFFLNASELNDSLNLTEVNNASLGRNSFIINSSETPVNGDYLLGLVAGDQLVQGNITIISDINGSPHIKLLPISHPDIMISGLSHNSAVTAGTQETVTVTLNSVYGSDDQVWLTINLHDSNGTVVLQIFDWYINMVNNPQTTQQSFTVPSVTGNYTLNVSTWVYDETNFTNNELLSAITVNAAPDPDPDDDNDDYEPGNPRLGGGSSIYIPTIEDEVDDIEANFSDVLDDVYLIDSLSFFNVDVNDLLSNLTSILSLLEDNTTANRSTLLAEAKLMLDNVTLLVPEVEVLAYQAGIKNNSVVEPDVLVILDNKTAGSFIEISVASVIEERRIYSARDRVTDEVSNVTVVSKRIYSNETIVNFTLVEVIPKSYAESVSDLIFYETDNLIVIEDDPIVAWVFDILPAMTEIEVSYEVKRDVRVLNEQSSHSVLVNTAKGDAPKEGDPMIRPDDDELDLEPITGFGVLGDGGFFMDNLDFMITASLALLLFLIIFFSRNKIKQS